MQKKHYITFAIASFSLFNCLSGSEDAVQTIEQKEEDARYQQKLDDNSYYQKKEDDARYQRQLDDARYYQKKDDEARYQRQLDDARYQRRRDEKKQD